MITYICLEKSSATDDLPVPDPGTFTGSLSDRAS
jgi:hypothetical protein